MQNLLTTIKLLGDEKRYAEQAKAFLDATNTKIEKKQLGFKKYFEHDTVDRCVFSITIKKVIPINGVYDKIKFDFGQSISNGSETPGAYEILACVEKELYEHFDAFCLECGYNNDSISAKTLYRDCQKQYQQLCTIYTHDEIEILKLIA